MKNDWKEEFYKVFEINQGSGRINGYITKNVGEDYSRPATVEDFEMYVEALLAEQKKELKEEALAREKLLVDMHRIELDAISCISLERFIKWSDDRRNRGNRRKKSSITNQFLSLIPSLNN